jgi:hypothetical protein
MYFSCSKPENTLQMENFNITLMSTSVGDRINLRKGKIEYYQRMDVEDPDFLLDSMEMNSIFTSVPWELLAGLPNYYNPLDQCKDGLDNQEILELVIINGPMHKTIRLKDCDDFSKESIERGQILQCIKTVHEIVRPKSTIKPLIKIEC